MDVWGRALSLAWSHARADRARELRGDRTVRRFDPRGLHPYSLEWGQVLACEALLPGLSGLRDLGPQVDPVTMRRLAATEAEQDFARAIRDDEADLWAHTHP